MERTPKILLFILSLFLILTCFFTFRVAVRQPFYLDETEEVTMGYKFSRIGPLAFLPVPEGGMNVTHPLLYTFSHAFIQRLFGSYEFPLRMYGVFHYLLSLGLLLLIIREIVQGYPRWLRYVGFASAVALYLINPLLVQHSVVINADNNILTTTLLLFLYFFVRFERRGQKALSCRLILAWLLALCFWTKELTPAFALCGIVTFRFLNREFKAGILDFLCIGIAGLMIFWLTWWFYCRITGTDIWGFVNYTLIGKAQRAFSWNYMKQIAVVFFYGFRWSLYWVSAPFFIAIFLFIVERCKQFLHSKRLEMIDLVFVTAVAIWLPYQLFRPTIDMVKYQYPAYPLFILALAWLLIHALDMRKKEYATGLTVQQATIIFISFFALTYHYFRLGDYLLVLWLPLWKHLHCLFLVYYYIPLIVFFILIMRYSKKSLRWAHCVIVAIFCIFPINAGLGMNQAKADYLTFEIWLNYGDSGLKETAEYLHRHLGDEEAIVSVREDVEYYLTNRYGRKLKKNITPDNFFLTEDDTLLKFFLTQAPIRYLVVDRISSAMRLNEQIFEFIEKSFVFQKQFGSFYIFKRSR